MHYAISSILAVLIVLFLTEKVGNYSEQWEEILSMNMVFMPIVFVVMIILEGIYQFVYRFYNKK